MSFTVTRVVEIPGSAGLLFDHGAFDPKTRRVFVAHTGCNSLEVIDHDSLRHVATLLNFPEAAGVVADAGQVLVTNRGAASLAWVGGDTLETRVVFNTGLRPNGVAFVPRLQLAVVACIGDETHGPKLQALSLDGDHHGSLDLPGRPRWCVTDTAGERVFLAIREPSMILTVPLPKLDMVQHWTLPSTGAHGLDIDRQKNLLYVRATAALSSKWTHSLEECLTNGQCPVCRMPHSLIDRLGSCMWQSVIQAWFKPLTRAPGQSRKSKQVLEPRRPLLSRQNICTCFRLCIEARLFLPNLREPQDGQTARP